MRDLDFFQRRFNPVSSSICFVNAPIEKIAPFWLKWNNDIFCELGWQVKFEEINGTLEDKLLALLPLNGRKNLLTETGDGGVAYFANHPSSPAIECEPGLWCETFKLRQIWIMCDDIKPGDAIGSVQFNYFDYAVTPRKQRIVYAYKDGRWSFNQHWEPLPFEDLEAYKEKRIRDRLTPEMVERYCQEFGINPYDTDFYKGRAYIMSLRPYPDFRELLEYPNQQTTSVDPRS